MDNLQVKYELLITWVNQHENLSTTHPSHYLKSEDVILFTLTEMLQFSLNATTVTLNLLCGMECVAAVENSHFIEDP